MSMPISKPLSNQIQNIPGGDENSEQWCVSFRSFQFINLPSLQEQQRLR